MEYLSLILSPFLLSLLPLSFSLSLFSLFLLFSLSSTSCLFSRLTLLSVPFSPFLLLEGLVVHIVMLPVLQQIGDAYGF